MNVQYVLIVGNLALIPFDDEALRLENTICILVV